MIQVTNLCKSFDSHKVLDNITLKIFEGELFCLMGTSGQGKSVFLQHLIGLLKPDIGTIEIDDIDITKLPEKKLLELRKNFGYLFQEGALFDYMDVYDNLALPLREHTRKSEQEISALIHHVLKEVELVNAETKYPIQLSGGMRKRVGLARAIILNPKIFFCDEPTSGLDPATGKAISRLIYKLCRELHATTVIVSHDVNNFLPLADRAAIIDEGKIIAVGTKEELEKSSLAKVSHFLLKD
ncbi:ABC transporter ATP-binding protein [Candidatus Omnitrophota bacterium]